MSNVTQFPTKDKALADLELQTKSLDDIYMALNQMYEAVTELELRAAEHEAVYDKCLKEYIGKVGLPKIPLWLLDYSGDAMDYYYQLGEER